jgi:cyclin A
MPLIYTAKLESRAELEKRPSTNYMEKLQQDICPSMCGILIDWLVEVTEECKLVTDTFYPTVNLIDRFLSTRLIQKRRLQLLCITCMFIASKYEKICAPRVEECCFMTDDKYTKQEVVKMEIEVLNLLRFHVMCSYNQNISQEIHPSSTILLQGSSLH